MRKFGQREKVGGESEMRERSGIEKDVDVGSWEGEDADSVGVGSSVREFSIPRSFPPLR